MISCEIGKITQHWNLEQLKEKSNSVIVYYNKEKKETMGSGQLKTF